MRSMRGLGKVAVVAAAILASAGVALASAGDGDDEPILVIDPGGHKSKIQDVIFTPDGRHLVSAGDDKVVRVWDVATGRTVRTIRGQVGPGDEGKIYAAALSSDGRTLAVGGWLVGTPAQSRSIRLHDFESGEVVGMLEGHGNVVVDLAFSSDGRRLASGSHDDTVRLWERTGDDGEWRSGPVLEGHEDYVYAVAFSPDGRRVASGSLDHTARLWEAETGRLIRELRGHDAEVRAVAFSPDGKLLATGSYDRTVRLWDARTGEGKGVLARQGSQVVGLSFSPRGDRLVTGVGVGDLVSHIFAMPSGEVVSRFRQDNLVLTTAFAPGGDLVATGGGSDKAIHLWNPDDGTAVRELVGDGRPVWSVAFASDGRSLAFGRSSGYQNLHHRGPLERVLDLRPGGGGFEIGLGPPVTSEKSFERARVEAGELRLETPSGGNDPVLHLLRGSETVHGWEQQFSADHRSFGFGPRGRWVVSGGQNGILTIYDAATGAVRHQLVGHTSDVWAVAVSPDGRLVASGSDDQTIRLWDPGSGRLLVSVFVGRDDEWVAWTPEGYYTASPGGERYIGWQVNRGVDRQADYYPVEQFRRQYYWSEVVNKTLELRDPVLALREAGSREPLGSERAAAAGEPGTAERPEVPPAVTFVAPRDGATVTEPSHPVRVLALSSGSPLTDLAISVGGRVVNKVEGRSKGDPRRREEEVEIDLEPGVNAITAVAATERSRASAEITVTYRPPPWAARTRAAPRLAVLAVGVADYAEPALQLDYADDDARDVAARFESQEGGAFSEVAVRVLTDAEVTRPAVLAGLRWLREQAPNRGDVRLLFLSGHGDVDGRGGFYFLTRGHRAGVDLEVDDLSWLTLLRRLTEGDATAVLMVDACHAAAVAGPGGDRAPTNFTDLLKEVNARATNLVTFAASTARQLSVERPEWRNGAFTEAILAGLSENGADGFVGGREDGAITVLELGAFVNEWVRKETGGAQSPFTQPSPGLDVLELYHLP